MEWTFISKASLNASYRSTAEAQYPKIYSLYRFMTAFDPDEW